MKIKYIVLLLIAVIVLLFWFLNRWTKFLNDNITPIVNEKIIVSQYDSSLKKEIANYYIDLKDETAFAYTWEYNTWLIINELDSKINDKILKNWKNNFDGAFYSYKTIDWKYLIFVARPIVTKYWYKIRLWWGSLYILELDTWKIKQIYIKELNKDKKYINKVVWIW